MRLSAQQDPLNDDDQHYDDDPRRSVHAPGDMAPFKVRADVSLVGHAFAPQGQSVASLVARLAIGSIDKSIAVHGERAWSDEGPKPVGTFSRLALRYERAAGGAGTANPAGLPGTASSAAVPSLEPLARRASEEVSPIGFGPLASDWPERKQRLGAHAEEWARLRLARAPLPDGFDGDYFCVAPADQRMPSLREDEGLTLEHLHRDHARLVTRLPGLRPQAFVERPGAGSKELILRADSLWIDTDRAVCTVTWRAALPLAEKGEPGRVLVAFGDPSTPLSSLEIARLATAASLVPPAAPSRPRRDDDGVLETVATRRTEPAHVTGPSTPPPRPPRPVAQKSAETPRTEPPARPQAFRTDANASPLVESEPAFDPELTNTDFFGPAAPTAVETMPAWLAPGPSRSATGDRPLPDATIERGLLELARPATPAPPESSPRSPWATGVATGASIVDPMDAPIRAVEAPRPSLRRTGAEVLDLLWFDPAATGRIRARWASLVEELDFEPLDPRHDLPAGDPAASRDRHHVFGVLTRAEPAAGQLSRDMLDAIGSDGRFTPPLVLVSGELRFVLDDLEVLKTMAACAEPIAKDDKRLAELVESVGVLAKSPLLQGASSAIDTMVRELRDAIAQSKRPLPVKYLDVHIERVLLEQRRYAKRVVFGEPCIRALFSPTSGGGAPVPTYLPEAVASKLPLVSQLRGRMLVEAHASQDQYETHPHALRVVALGRQVQIDGARR